MESRLDEDSREGDGAIDVVALGYYANLLLRRKWLILGVVAVFLGSAFIYNQRQVPFFQATASFILNPKPPPILGTAVQEPVSMGNNTWGDRREYYQSQIKVLNSQSLITRTVREKKLHESPHIIGNMPIEPDTERARLAVARGTLTRGLSLRGPKEDRVIYVSVMHTNPTAAAAMANAHVESYIEFNLSLRSEGNHVAAKWLSNELTAATTQLEAAELAVFDFKKSHDLLYVSLKDQRSLLAANVAHYTAAINAERVKRIAAAQFRKQLRAVSGGDPLETPVFEIADSAAGKTLRQQYYDAKRKLDSMAAVYGPSHPEYIQQNRITEKVRSDIKQEIAILLNAADQNHKALAANENALQDELNRQKKLAFELGPTEVAFNRLLRSQKDTEDRFNLIRERLRASQLAGRLTSINVQPLDPAVIPSGTTNPTLKRDLLAALALALMVGPGFVFLLAALNRRIKLPTDIEQTLGETVMGVIPEVVDEPNVALAVYRHPNSPTAEACRAIRTNLLFASPDDEIKTVLVTSASEREGKTTSIMYLGTVIAQSEQKVLMIESDLRRPTLHRYNGVPGGQGLSDLVVGKADLDKVIKSTDVPNLYLLPCGAPPPNPSELLMTKRFAQVLETLKERFDVILLDSPPVLAVTDASILSRHADTVLFLVRADQTEREDARRALAQLRSVQAKISGCVLNSLDIRGLGYAYGYGYGYTTDPAPEQSPA